jgi:hypothetical protein
MNSCVKLLNFFPNENMEHIFIPQYMKAVDLLINRTDHTNERFLSDNVEVEQQNQSPTGEENGAQLHGVSDVKTLEYLARIHVMLAQLVGKKSSDFTEYCLFAVACVQRMWKVWRHFSVVAFRCTDDRLGYMH